MIYGPRQIVLSHGEIALYLSTMGNALTGDTPISYVKSFSVSPYIPWRQTLCLMPGLHDRQS